MLSGENITKNIGRHEILHGINVSVQPGEVTVVVGPNGAGKTAALRCLALTDPPSKGMVKLDGKEFAFPEREKTFPPPWPAVTVCFQQLFLWPHLTLRRSIELVLKNVTDQETARRAFAEYSRRLELEDLLDRYPNECSLGQRQKAAVLRALVLNPKYILCDELTSALDIEAALTVVEILSELKRSGVGILLITHQLGLAARVANTVVFMENGVVVEDGGAEILTSPKSERFGKFLSVMETV